MLRILPTPHETICVGLIEDDLLYRDYLLNVLEASGRYTTIICASSVEEAATWNQQLRLQAVLCDINLPGQPGPAIVAHLSLRFPGLRTIMLTAHDDTESILESFRAGAFGYIVKGATSGEIIEALDDVVAGGAPMSPTIARQVLELLRKPLPATLPAAAIEPEPLPPSPASSASWAAAGRSARGSLPPIPAATLEGLTPRENDVLALVVEGRADKEVASQLGISRSAVKNHLANIYAKWRVRSRTEAAVRFVQARQP